MNWDDNWKMGKKPWWRCDSASGPLLVHHQMGWTLQFRSSTPSTSLLSHSIPNPNTQTLHRLLRGKSRKLTHIFCCKFDPPNNRSQGFPWFFLYHPWRMPSCKTKIRCGTWTARSIQQGSSSNIVVAKLCASWDALMGLGGKWQGANQTTRISVHQIVAFLGLFCLSSFFWLRASRIFQVNTVQFRDVCCLFRNLCVFVVFFCVFFLGAVWKDPAGLRLCGYTFLGTQKFSLKNPILSRTSSPKASLEVFYAHKNEIIKTKSLCA